MNIHLLIGQRKEKYDGEYAPEVLEAMDEYGYNENPFCWLNEKLKEYQDTNEFEAVKIITIMVPHSEIMKQLIPNDKPITAAIVNP